MLRSDPGFDLVKCFVDNKSPAYSLHFSKYVEGGPLRIIKQQRRL